MAGILVGGTDQIQNYRNRVVAAVTSGNGRDRCDLLLGDEQLTGLVGNMARSLWTDAVRRARRALPATPLQSRKGRLIPGVVAQ